LFATPHLLNDEQSVELTIRRLLAGRLQRSLERRSKTAGMKPAARTAGVVRADSRRSIKLAARSVAVAFLVFEAC
jgi:hypothetical protein